MQSGTGICYCKELYRVNGADIQYINQTVSITQEDLTVVSDSKPECYIYRETSWTGYVTASID